MTSLPRKSSVSTPPKHLIILCCHAIYNPVDSKDHSSYLSPSSWLLQPFQPAGEIPTFIAHITTALNLLSSSPDALLVISGGPTRSETSTSEAASYFNVLMGQKSFDHFHSSDHPGLFWRIILEKRALDSMSNIIYSLMEFWKRVGKWPEKITIVSQGFKEKRFMKLHVRTLGLEEMTTFIGIDPVYMDEKSEKFDKALTEEVRAGEWQRAYRPWSKDLFGVGDELSEKRRSRNSWGTSQVWFSTEDEREKSGVKSEVRSLINNNGDQVKEEVLVEGQQPWC